MVTRRNEDLTMLLKEYLVELNGDRVQAKAAAQIDYNDRNEDNDGDDDFEMDDELIQATRNRKSHRE